METRESLGALTNDQIRSKLRERNIGGASGLKKADLIELYMNPPSVRKSPGRPPGSGVKKAVEDKGKGKAPGTRKPRIADTAKTVEYSRQGLETLTLNALKDLAKRQNVGAVSNKNKGDVVSLLLSKHNATDVVIIHKTPAGKSDTVTVLASGRQASQSQVSQPQQSVVGGSLAPPPASFGAFGASSSLAPPPNFGSLAPPSTSGNLGFGSLAPPLSGSALSSNLYVPQPGFRQ